MTSLWTKAGLSWRCLLRRIFREIIEDDVFGRSAELAYFFLLSAFPLLLCLTSAFGHVMGQRADLRQQLFEYLDAVMPTPEALALVSNTLEEIIEQRGLHFSFGLVISIWAASQGFVAIGRVLNWAYEAEGKRPFWRAQLVALGLIAICTLLVTTALVLMFYGGSAVRDFHSQPAMVSLVHRLWGWAQWPVILLFLVAAFELIYNFAPAGLDRRQLHWTSPGAMVGVGIWIAASEGFRFYLSKFDHYTWAYGSLGALIVLLFWFYLTGFAILIGGEINSEIVKALAEREGRRPRTAPTGRPKPQQRRPGH